MSSPSDPENEMPEPAATVVTLRSGKEVTFEHVSQVNLFAPVGVGLRNGDGQLIAFYPFDQITSVVTPARDCEPTPKTNIVGATLMPFPGGRPN